METSNGEQGQALYAQSAKQQRATLAAYLQGHPAGIPKWRIEHLTGGGLDPTTDHLMRIGVSLPRIAMHLREKSSDITDSSIMVSDLMDLIASREAHACQRDAMDYQAKWSDSAHHERRIDFYDRLIYRYMVPLLNRQAEDCQAGTGSG